MEEYKVRWEMSLAAGIPERRSPGREKKAREAITPD
jgi:hypothetical protein